MSRRSWILAGVTLTGLVLAVRFGLGFPWGATMDALGNADPLLLAGAGVANIVSLMAKGAVWYLLLRRIGAARSSTTQSATFVAAAVNSITVAGSGEAVRAQLVHDRDGIPYSKAVASLVATRVAEALGLLFFLSVSLAWIRPWPGAYPVALGLFAVGLIPVLCSCLVPRRTWHPSVAGLAPVSGLFWSVPVLVAALNWGAQWITYHWSLQATGSGVTAAVSLAALVLANVAGILRLTPGNLGVVQASIMLGLHAFNFSAAQGLAGGLALQAVQVLPILTIAVGIVGARGFRQLAADRSGTA